jgi:glycosyltransferase involved in cell wall biosynthesis
MSSWDNEISSAALSLAKELAKQHRVFYFDNPFTLKDFVVDYKHRKIQTRRGRFFSNQRRCQPLPHLGPGFHAVTPSLTLPVNFLPRGAVYRFFLRINRWVVERNLRQLLKQYHISRYIFFNSFNPFYHGIAKGSLLLTVYQSRDDISQITYASKHGVALEVEAIRASSISFATSKQLALTLQQRTQRPVHYLPNAVDVAAFPHTIAPASKPLDIASIHQPIIGYVGNLDQRVDYALLHRLAIDHPDKTLVCIGPRNDHGYHNHDFESLPNVLFLGPKPHDQLYRYLHFMACAIIPFVKNTLTASIYPLKINEYLAMGKPVVTTDFSEDVLGFCSVCYVAADAPSFSQMIDKAVLPNDNQNLVQQRVAFARNNSWEARIASFWQTVGPLL